MFVARSDLLPICRELVLPIPMPLRFVFPPMVAVALSFVRPVPDRLGPASGNEVIAATRASAFGAWAGFNSFVVV